MMISHAIISSPVSQSSRVEITSAGLVSRQNLNNEERLAARWADFVNPQQRMLTMLPFLSRFIKSREAKALDAAMGLGNEAIILAHAGLQVTGNEICPVLC